MLERLAVGHDRLGIVAERVHRGIERARRGRHARPPSEVGAERLVRDPRPAPAAGSRRSSTPAIATPTPPSGSSSPASTRSSVDFPIPFGPTTPSRAPGFTVTDTPPSTTCAPWWRSRSLATSTRSDATGAPPTLCDAGYRCDLAADPVPAGLGAGLVLDDVLEDAAGSFDDRGAADVVVVAGDEHPVDAEGVDALEALAQDLGGVAAAAVRRQDAVADVAALVEQEVVEPVADRRAARRSRRPPRRAGTSTRRSGPSAARRARCGRAGRRSRRRCRRRRRRARTRSPRRPSSRGGPHDRFVLHPDRAQPQASVDIDGDGRGSALGRP